jgi:pimeloyl-ACP methyl ester carboxylesterase
MPTGNIILVPDVRTPFGPPGISMVGPSMTKTPTLLLVHGSWHGPWCWERLVPELSGLGMRSVTVALPSCGTDPAALGIVADDVAASRRQSVASPETLWWLGIHMVVS